MATGRIPRVILCTVQALSTTLYSSTLVIKTQAIASLVSLN